MPPLTQGQMSDLGWSLTWQVVLRVGLAFVAGSLLGLERESHGRAAGLRTTMLVCVSAAIAMIISEQYFLHSKPSGGNWRPDPARLAAGVLTGMGFLGAGAIMREGHLVRGVTTAAVLWFVTVLGLAFGSGQIALGLLGLGIALLSLLLLPHLEKFIRSDWYVSITVTAALEGACNEDIEKCIESRGITTRKVDLLYDLEQARKTVHYDLKLKKDDRRDLGELSQRIVQDVLALPGVTKVKWV